MRGAVIGIAVFLPTVAFAGGWEKTKNIADEIIYEGESRTFYCGCLYASHGDTDGSGHITDTVSCGYFGPGTHAHRAGRVEWEHIARHH